MFAFAFDTETTGMVDWQKLPQDPAQPNLVQLAGILVDVRDWREIAMMSVIIRPDGWTIPDEAAAVHGITQEHAEYFGISLENAIMLFTDLAARADIMLAHNMDFDRIVVERAKQMVDEQQGVVPTLPWQAHHEAICTKIAATDVVQIPKKDNRHGPGFKWPSLNECSQFFWGHDIDGAHDALVDVRACIGVFYELIERDLFPKLKFNAEVAA